MPLRPRLVCLVLLLAAALLPASARAAPLVLLEDQRRVFTDAEYCTDACDVFGFVVEETLPDSPFAPFDHGQGLIGYGAAQTSSIGTTAMSGLGQVVFDPDLRTHPIGALPQIGDLAESLYEVAFEVVTPTEVQLGGSFRMSGDFGTEGLYGTYELRRDDVVLDAVSLDGSADDFASFSLADTLDPGLYRLTVAATADDAGPYALRRALFSFALVVPEPSTGLLVGAALLALVRGSGRGREPGQPASRAST